VTEIVIVNRCTVLSDAEIAAVVPAFRAQVVEDWLPHWPGRGAALAFAGLNDTVPAGAWPLYIMDTSDVPGAGGYHDDDDGGLPQGKVFAADAMAYGEEWTVDATHELLEMLGDPDANTILPVPHSTWHCYQEVCDAVEADRYAYRKPAWRGVLLTDFCLPRYFTGGGSGPFDFALHLTKPAPALLHGGYLAIELADGEWTQIVKRREDGSMGRRARRNGRIARRLGEVKHAARR